MKLGYPVKLAALGISMHTAPRTIRAYDHHVPMGRPSKWIIAGCTQSNQFARTFLHAIITKVHEASPYNDQHIWEGVPEEWSMHIASKPWNDIQSFVDDVSQTVRAKWPVMPVMTLAKAAKNLKTRALADGLVISIKIVVRSLNQKEGRVVVRHLSKLGVTTSLQRHAKDLGVGRSLN